MLELEQLVGGHVLVFVCARVVPHIRFLESIALLRLVIHSNVALRLGVLEPYHVAAM
jgi:hypothetical protein